MDFFRGKERDLRKDLKDCMVIGDLSSSLIGAPVFIRDPRLRGETGCMPRINPEFNNLRYKVLHKYAQRYPKSVNPDSMGIHWSEEEVRQRFWSDLPKGALNFTWHRGEAVATAAHQPINFTSDTDWLDDTVMTAGFDTLGTSFRRKYKNLKPDAGVWRKNAIANIYHVTISCSIDPEAPATHMIRHGVAGLLHEETEHLVPQMTELFRYAAVKSGSRPLRFVSINAMHLPAIVTVEEGKMVQRQSATFAAARDQLRREGINIELSEMYFPLNTDVGGIDDVNSSVNFAGVLTLLGWLGEDFINAAGELVKLPEFKDIQPPSLEKVSSRIGDGCCAKGKVTPSPSCHLHTWHKCFSGAKDWPSLLKRMRIVLSAATGQGRTSHFNGSEACMCGIAALFSVGEYMLVSGAAGNISKTPEGERVEQLLMALGAASVLFEVELFPDEDKGKLSDETSRSWFGGARRRYSRINSVLALCLIHEILGTFKFVNCKSGLDRTGIYGAAQSAISSLYKLYPESRWNLVQLVSSYNLLRGRVAEEQPGFITPRSSDKDAAEAIEQKLRSGSTLNPLGTKLTGSLVQLLDLQGDEGSQESLFPLFSVLRNFWLVYSAELNCSITTAGTGVRGLKYDRHPLIGQFIPQAIEKKDGQVASLTSYQIASLKQLSSYKLKADSLSEVGHALLIDCASSRSS